MKAVFIFIILFISVNAFSQDKIHLKNGKIEEVKITEITEKTIRYKLYDNLSGPDYILDKTRIIKIVYENGTIERFSGEENAPTMGRNTDKNEKPRKERKDYGNHYVAMNLSDLIRTDLCVHYEYLFNRGIIGLRVPLLYGFNSNYFNLHSTLKNAFVFKRNRVFETGIDLRYYPGGQGVVRYVFGPAFHYILNNKRGAIMNGAPVGNHHINTLRWLIYNGIVFSPTKNFRFGLDVGLGSQYDLTETNYSNRGFGDPKVQFNFYIGGKF